MSNLQQTLSIIKPDAVERNLENEIKEMFKSKGFNILKEKKVKIYKNDNIKTLSKRILKQEHKLYPAAIKKLFN